MADEVVEAGTTATKRHLNKSTDNKGLLGNGSNVRKWNQLRWASWSTWINWGKGSVLYDSKCMYHFNVSPALCCRDEWVNRMQYFNIQNKNSFTLSSIKNTVRGLDQRLVSACYCLIPRFFLHSSSYFLRCTFVICQSPVFSFTPFASSFRWESTRGETCWMNFLLHWHFFPLHVE